MEITELTDKEIEILQDNLLCLIEDEENYNSLSRDEDYIKELRALYKKVSSRAIPKAGDVYRHFKGKYYEIIAVGHHSETGEQMVVYYDTSKEISNPNNPCIRPFNLFMSEVDRKKYPNPSQRYRFEKVN